MVSQLNSPYPIRFARVGGNAEFGLHGNLDSPVQGLQARVTDHVVAIALCESQVEFDAFTILHARQRAVRDFWTCSPYRCEPMFFFRIMEKFVLTSPVKVWESSLRHNKQGWFFKMTDYSKERICEAACMGGATVWEKLCQWGAAYPLHVHESSLACVNLPPAHCWLLGYGPWDSYGFPLPSSSQVRNGLRMSLVKVLWLWESLGMLI